MRIAITLVLLLSAVSTQAQTWDELQAVPANTEVRVEEWGRSGGHAEGILQSVEAVQLTIVRGTSPVAIARDRIARVQVKKRDPLWEGVIVGLLYAVAMDLAYRDESWTAKQTAGHYVGSAGICALIDWGHQSRRTVYRAP